MQTKRRHRPCTRFPCSPAPPSLFPFLLPLASCGTQAALKEQRGSKGRQRQRYAISHMYLYPSDMKRINCGKTNCIRMRCLCPSLGKGKGKGRRRKASGEWQLLLVLLLPLGASSLEAKRQSNPGFAFYRNVATTETTLA